MKHQPLLEVLAIAVIFFCLGLLAYRLSSQSPDSAHEHHHSHHNDVSAEHVTTWATFKFAHSPVRVEIRQDDQILWTHNPQGEKLCEEELNLAMDAGQIEVLLHIEWPENIRETIVELTLEPDNLESKSLREWGQGHIASRMVFDWNAP